MIISLLIIALSFIFLLWYTGHFLFALFFAVLVPIPVVFIAWCLMLGIANQKTGEPHPKIEELLKTDKK